MVPYRDGRAAMRGWAVRLISIFLLLALGSPMVALAKNKGLKGQKKQKKHAATPTPTPAPGEQNLTNIPLPVGHEAKGLILPDFDADGNLRGRFEAGKAKRIDADHGGFQDLKIITYTPEKKIDLQIEMHTSVLDLKTKVLSSQERTVVKRADFNIVGESVQFDTVSRTGRLIGNVKMEITDQSDLVGKKKE